MPMPKKWDSKIVLDSMFEAFKSNENLKDFRSQQVSNVFSDKLMKFNFEEELSFIAPLFAFFPSKLVFCHNDLNRTNILIRNNSSELDLTRRMVIIDFEYAAYGYRWSDFVVIFAEVCFCHWKESRKFMVSKYPDKKKRLFIARNYVKAINRDQEQTLEDEQTRRLEAEMAFGILPACLINILWRLSHKQIDQENEKNLWVSTCIYLHVLFTFIFYLA